MKYKVVFSPEAEEQLLTLYHYLADVASPDIAHNYTSGIIDFCEQLDTFPLRGNQRDDVRPGLRTTHFKKQTVIAFSVEHERIAILGIFYGGQDYEALLQFAQDD
ncbi:MAG: type II toxin-antitoxin system RelE/ParE family toxin [Cellvibrio sp.]|uniref:type II toxin-antitoxin system RelE/ParE family toxin n=1 Tax=Cellvibrio sp. TaxID=1965322 RepID=UPI0031A82958